MIKLTNVSGDSSSFNMNFYKGSYNLLVFRDENVRLNLIRSVLKICERNFSNIPYIISGFNLKPYLNLVDNIYSSFGIDLHRQKDKRLIFNNYCRIFDLQNYNVRFSLLSNIDKLKSMFIVSLFSDNEVVLFDNSYSPSVARHTEYIIDLIRRFKLFSDNVFIEIRKIV